MSKPEQDEALATLPPEENEELAPVSVDTTPKKQPKSNSFGMGLKRVLGFLLRLFLFLLFLAALGVGAYYGLPYLYEKYVRPVEVNTSQMANLTGQQSQQAAQIADLETRIATLEAEQIAQAEIITDLSTRVDAVEEQIAAHTATLSTLDEMQASLQSASEETRAELKRQIKLLKAMELLSRARLFLYQSNFGLAKQDVQIARDLLAEIQPDAPEVLAIDVKETLLRLDLVIQNLPSFPVAASDDLDIAWQILLQGIPPQGVETPAPETLSTPTPETEITPTSTP